MSSLIILAVMIVSATGSSQSSIERDTEGSSPLSPNNVDFDLVNLKKLSKTTSNGAIGMEINERPDENDEDEPAVSSTDDFRTRISLKKGRKNKAFFHDYPFASQFINRYNSANGNYDLNLRNNEDKLSNRKHFQQQESQIYYIKLPPTPYMYVPGLGYISQPPTYSTSGLQRPHHSHHSQRPTRPQNNYHKPGGIGNPFIKVPIDFVSNGKPTGVYQWQGANKRTESSLNSLNDGPYVFNGRPTSLYLLTADGQKTGHQPIRLADYTNDLYY